MEAELRGILQNCRTVQQLQQTHAQVLLRGLHAPLLRKLIATSFSLRRPTHAIRIFRAAPSPPDLPTHNLLIRSLARHGHPHRALSAHAAMIASALRPDSRTFTSLLAACSLLAGVQLHAQILRCGFSRHLHVLNALLDHYAKLGPTLALARRVFDEMPLRDVVSWNSMLNAYMRRGHRQAALRLFKVMPERSLVSWNSVLSGLARAGEMHAACELFERMPARDAVSWNTMITACAVRGDMAGALALFNEMEGRTVVSWTTMITGYGNTGDLLSMERLFHLMPTRNAVAWNAVIAAYNRNSRYNRALETFRLMLVDGDFKPNESTLVSAASACAHLGALEHGNWIYSYIRRSDVRITITLGNSLIDMFAKCGDVRMSELIFRQMTQKCVITWTTLISGLGLNGNCREAVTLFAEMCMDGMELDDVAFIVVLTACAHGGLVEEGRQIYSRMGSYGIKPTAKHQGCMVDLLSRAGMVEEAIKFIEGLPKDPGVVTWAALLSACRTHGNLDIIDYVSRKIDEKGAVDAGYKLLVSNAGASVGRWEDVASTRGSLKSNGVEKVPGCSSIQIGGKVHEFLAKDTEHEMREEVYEVLSRLTRLLCQDLCEDFVLGV